MKHVNKFAILIILSFVIFSVLSCESTPEEDTGGALAKSDLVGSWDIGKEFTYKDSGVAYGKAIDTLIFTEGSSENTLFLEVKVMMVESMNEAPEGFEKGTTHTLYLNETGVNISNNNVSLDAKSPYISPSTFSFTFVEGDKSKFTWDGIEYTKQ